MRTRALAALILVLTLSLSVVTGVALARGATLPLPTALTHLAGGGGGSGTHPANHGAAVSKAAHTCAHGAHAVHGKCVRSVAKSAAGKK
jgi:hypothetical protein